MRAWAYRFCAAGSVLALFLGLSCLYAYGNRGLYEDLLRVYGIVPFHFPFIDISGSLAAWECARQGIDVILSNPCDALKRGYTYSPIWMAAAAVPLGVNDTIAVGWALDLLFIASLSLLPSPRRPLELALVLAATLSTMVVFALERANPDILLFMMLLAAGLCAQCRSPLRLVGYSAALLAALIKYYPVMALVVVLRERPRVVLGIALAVAAVLALFVAEYHAEIAKGWPHIPRGPYHTDLFGAQNLPAALSLAVEDAVRPPSAAALAAGITRIGLYAVLICAAIAICRRLLRWCELRAALATLTPLERQLLVIGSAVIVGCFFAGQSIGYRGIFLLLVMPGLLAVSRVPLRRCRALGLGAAIVVVLLMWGECFRINLHAALQRIEASETVAGAMRLQFWFWRELGWWWIVSVMLAILADFVGEAPILRGTAALLARSFSVVRVGRAAGATGDTAEFEWRAAQGARAPQTRAPRSGTPPRSAGSG
jgi:hypothetical protein